MCYNTLTGKDSLQKLCSENPIRYPSIGCEEQRVHPEYSAALYVHAGSWTFTVKCGRMIAALL
jgi:hypothetical protein